MRKLRRLLVVLVVLVVVLVVLVIFYADHLTKVGVETAGTQALGVKTQVAKADLSLLGGTLSLESLEVANPEGFETDYLLAIGGCSTKVKIGSLFSDTIVVETILLEGLTLTIEQKGLTSNLETVLKNIEKMKKEPSEKKDEAEEKPGKRLSVERVEIVDAGARIKLLPIPGQADVLEIKLAPIVLEDITPDRNRAELAGTVFREVLLAVAGAAVEAGGDKLPAGLRQGLDQAISGLEEVIGTVREQISENAGKALGEGVKAIDKVGKDLLKLPGQLGKGSTEDEASQGD